MHAAAADGRQRRAIGCAPLALLNFAAARAPRDAWVAVAEARRAGRQQRQQRQQLRRIAGVCRVGVGGGSREARNDLL